MDIDLFVYISLFICLYFSIYLLIFLSLFAYISLFTVSKHYAIFLTIIGSKRTRTADIRLARAALYQLSHTPIK